MSQPATLLVIDDEPQIRKFLRISLTSQGYKVVEAATGGEGLAQAALAKPDLVVLDPPRTGAGRAVVEAVAASGASRIAYVACDPAALGRDLGHARQAGLEVERVVGFDAFGTTHHLEAIATLRRARG